MADGDNARAGARRGLLRGLTDGLLLAIGHLLLLVFLFVGVD